LRGGSIEHRPILSSFHVILQESSVDRKNVVVTATSSGSLSNNNLLAAKVLVRNDAKRAWPPSPSSTTLGRGTRSAEEDEEVRLRREVGGLDHRAEAV
jgi:hypothetical protein